jgi:hypothetical protein
MTKLATHWQLEPDALSDSDVQPEEEISTRRLGLGLGMLVPLKPEADGPGQNTKDTRNPGQSSPGGPPGRFLIISKL